jgi:predicted lipoprotein with Yx(FWY)xxD motif
MTGAGLATVVALGAAACGGSSTGGQPADAVSPSTSGSSAAAASIGTAHGDGGTFLTDSTGRTLYLFEADTTSKSTCGGPCAAAWPPAVTSGTPTATGDAKAGKLGTTERSDGTTQVTYAGHPLYLYAGDQKPGDTNGAGLDDYGAEWYPVTPAGETLESGDESEDGASPSPSSSDDTGYSYSY